MILHLKARAKINLALDVTGKRPDGYHDVRMIMQSVGLYDEITMEDTRESGVVLKTNWSFIPTDESNLCCRAARLLMDEFGITGGVSIYLEKTIPVAAGLAGGSADAAAVMVGMNRLFSLKLSGEQLRERAVKIGADVPFCIMGGTALSEGIGEILTPLPSLPDCSILIVKPHISVSTKYVYENLRLDGDMIHPDVDGMVDAIGASDLGRVAGLMGNVLETVAGEKYPVIGELKELLISRGALGALMSGSGSAVFGIFEDDERAQEAARAARSLEGVRQVFVRRPYGGYH